MEESQKRKKSISSKEEKELLRLRKQIEGKKIKYLEAEVEYLKTERSFLAKLPKKKKN